MKQTDFERLKQICEKEGFHLASCWPATELFIIKPKDIWEGVEFVQSISPTSSCTTQWKIYKVKQITEKNICIEIDDYLSTTTHFVKKKSKPSTEKAYAEQLKSEVFKRFGEIKENQAFIEPDGKSWCLPVNYEKSGNYKWCYEKEFDKFYFYSLLVYEKGKWATRVKEKVKVDPNRESIAKYVKEVTDEQRKELRVLLASKLEEYLNETK